MLRRSWIQSSKIIVVSSILSLMAFEPIMAQSESKQIRTLVVTGNAVEQISTTIAEVRLGVEIQDKTAAEVQQKIATQTSAVVDLLRSQNIKQLQTTGIRLSPNYSSQSNDSHPLIVSYTGINTLSFQMPIDRVGRLLDEAIAAGASRIDGISFTATDKAKETAKEEALRQATINARNKAEVVLSTLDLTANEIVNIKLERANIESPPSLARGQFAALESIPIIGGQQTVEADVTLQISY